jgi:hypothetical protein
LQATKFEKVDDHSELVVKARQTPREGNCDGNADDGDGDSYYSVCDPTGVYDPQALFVDRNFQTQDESSLLTTPTWLYNATILYQKYGIEWDLACNYQGNFIEDLRDNFIDKYNQPYGRMDFHSRYNFKSGVTVGFDMQNVLDSWGYYTSKGPSPGYQKDYIEPGRTFLVNISYSY